MVGGTRSYEMAQRMIKAGHEVVMISSNHDGDSKSDGWYQTDEDGIEVHWLPVPYSNKLGFWGRMKTFFSFAFGASAKAASFKGDIIFATSTPLTIAIPALYASWRTKTPFVFEVRDLWPEAPIQMGWLKNPLLIWLARRLEQFTYKRAAHIVALTPGMKAGVVEAGQPREKVTMIPNSSDLELFSPDVDGSSVKERLQIGDRFSLAYFGTMGEANGLQFVLDAAMVLKQRSVDDVVFVLHGDGRERERLVKFAKENGLANVIFSDPVPDKNEIARLAAAVDVCMTIYKNVPVLYTCSPNKMFDSFSAGKPVLTNMPGWLQSLVEDNECGVFVEPDDAVGFAEKVLHLRDNKHLLPEMGRRARTLAEQRFSRDLLGAQLTKVLEDAAEKAWK